MVLLPKDFEIERYGVYARLVDEGDSEFITKLRSDPRLGKYIHSSDGDVQKQIEWTHEYKKRESVGLDYYFIFYYNNEPIGVNRIYNIDWTHLSFTGGSWIMRPGLDVNIAMIPTVIMQEIQYEILGLLINIYEVNKKNTQVVKFHQKVLRAIVYGETDINYLFMSTPDTRKISKLKYYLGI